MKHVKTLKTINRNTSFCIWR